MKVKISQQDFATQSDEWLSGFEAGVLATQEAYQNQPRSIEDELKDACTAFAERLSTGVRNPMTGCTSYLQRKLGCGYNHAALLIELMVERGWLTQTDDRGARTFNATHSA